MKKLKINHAAVWVTVVIAQVIPAMWYGLFQDPWMEFNNLSFDDTESAGITPFLVSILASAATAYMLAWVFVRMNVQTPLDGFKSALVIAFPFTILNMMTINMFSFRPFMLAWIDGGQQLLIWIVAGIILGSWRKYA